MSSRQDALEERLSGLEDKLQTLQVSIWNVGFLWEYRWRFDIFLSFFGKRIKWEIRNKEEHKIEEREQ